MKRHQEDFLMHLLESGAIKFGEFRLKSGRVSPYFVNIAVAINTGRRASETADAYVAEIVDGAVGTDFDYIHGPAYKGIPLSVLIAEKLWSGGRGQGARGIDLRWGYDRKEEKRYGDPSETKIVGDLRDGDSVLIVDDVVVTGKTKIDNWAKLTDYRDLSPKGILVAVDRQEVDEAGNDTIEMLTDAGLTVYPILKITEIFDYLLNRSIGEVVYVDDRIQAAFDEYFEEHGVDL
ncbi:MAG: orotate phosphoribosyltransferase [Methanosarcinales archaeon]|nr:orotate phosphoribosyltransferase [Methanosarcinales archaeon]